MDGLQISCFRSEKYVHLDLVNKIEVIEILTGKCKPAVAGNINNGVSLSWTSLSVLRAGLEPATLKP